jgi:hypothetical protein
MLSSDFAYAVLMKHEALLCLL